MRASAFILALLSAFAAYAAGPQLDSNALIHLDARSSDVDLSCSLLLTKLLHVLTVLKLEDNVAGSAPAPGAVFGALAKHFPEMGLTPGVKLI